MKRFLKIVIGVAVMSSGIFLTKETSYANAATSHQIKNKCQYVAKQGENPDLQTMNCLLTETALSYNVPSEIVKAIAEKESGGWKHFDESGQPIVTEDNGIGVMQITNQSQYDSELLKNDITYNIQAGVEILNQMFQRTDLPTINNKERDVLEHWYFAIMAYNGTKPLNSPIVQATGQRNTDAYQEKIYQNLQDYGLLKTTKLPFTSDDFQYDPNSKENISFKTMNYHFNVPFTKTKHTFTKGQQVATTATVHLRERASTSSGSKGRLTIGEKLTITGPFAYEENTSSKNHFIWFPVKKTDGTTGYVASSYLKYQFKDIPAGNYAEDSIYYLVDRGLLYGVGNDNFGFKQPLTRWQAVLFMTRVNNVSLENRPNPRLSDVPTTYKYYKEIAAAVDEGLFVGNPDKTFKPNATLTRSEMAVVLQNVYQFPAATGEHPFTDVNPGWYADAVTRLYASGITGGITNTLFGPKETITREQFASFLVRSMDESYRIN